MKARGEKYRMEVKPVQGVWVVLQDGTPVANFETKTAATDFADKQASKTAVGKMSWSAFKEAEGIDSSIFNDNEGSTP